jgi:antitoxin component YwqK of YwqJK toxin-antitoxin module
MKFARRLLFILLFFIPLVTVAQSVTSTTDTVVNRTDGNGLKQGHWITYYEKGNKKYEGFFKDDKPVGTFTRYYEEKGIQSIMEFAEDGKEAYIRIFYNNGKLAAEGKYIERLKHGEWRYHSYYDSRLSYSENYVHGGKHGISTVYYPNGKVSEILNFSKNKKDGEWIQYFENGRVSLKSTFRAGKLHGNYVQYHPTGMPYVVGAYNQDRRDGEWCIYNEKGEEVMKFDFMMGVARNQDELDRKQEEFLNQLEKNKGKIREPQLSDIQF